MNNTVMENTSSTAASKAELFGKHVWSRLESDASTEFTQETADDWARGESNCSEDNSACQTTAGPKDWRPLTQTLRQELACALQSQNELHQETLCSEAIPSTSRDWRPTTVTLRRALHAHVDVKKQEAQTLINPCSCPARITADSLDWRPSTVMFRNQLAAVQ